MLNLVGYTLLYAAATVGEGEVRNTPVLITESDVTSQPFHLSDVTMALSGGTPTVISYGL